MTPEELDVAYQRLAASLGAAPDPVLVRDRLILYLIGRLGLQDALAAIEKAELEGGKEALKRPTTQAGPERA
ncbi:MAG: hypothetical protein ACRDVP_09540 [Acidimicrobiales bacterium]